MGEVEEEKPHDERFRGGENLRNSPYDKLTLSTCIEIEMDRFTEIYGR